MDLDFNPGTTALDSLRGREPLRDLPALGPLPSPHRSEATCKRCPTVNGTFWKISLNSLHRDKISRPQKRQNARSPLGKRQDKANRRHFKVQRPDPRPQPTQMAKRKKKGGRGRRKRTPRRSARPRRGLTANFKGLDASEQKRKKKENNFLNSPYAASPFLGASPRGDPAGRQGPRRACGHSSAHTLRPAGRLGKPRAGLRGSVEKNPAGTRLNVNIP